MPHTLLLADDSVTIQRVIELTFADEDVHVLTVGDGDQAIAAIDQKPPDIVLADIGMPGRDGYEVAQHVKKTPRLAHIPVLLLTGAFEPVDQVRASAVGCDGVLAKPFEPQLVIGRVRELLARQPSAPVTAAPPSAAPQPAEPTLDERSPGSRPHRLVNDEYFDELDQAFATLTASAQRRRERSPEPPGDEAVGWFSRTPNPPSQPEKPPAEDADAALDAWTVPVPKPSTASPTTPPSAVAASAPSAPSTPSASAPGGPSAAAVSAQVPAPVSGFPRLADAFVALLAAEQASSPAAAAPVWPSATAAAVSQEMVEAAARRVLQDMSQEAVRDIVTEIAERLVREEIERIRKSIT